MERVGHEDGIVDLGAFGEAKNSVGSDRQSSEGAAPCPTCLTQADMQGLLEATFVREIEFHTELGSTNDRALQIARGRPGQGPILILAAEQTAGRGRGGNQWWSRPGALTFSLLLDPAEAQLPARLWPRTSLTVALAIAEALVEFVGDTIPVQLKWPNDVFIEEQKVCGILVELPRAADQRPWMVVGVGINVNNSLQHAPHALQASATALCDVTGRHFALRDVLVGALQSLHNCLNDVGSGSDLLDRWRARCLLSDREVEVDLGSRNIIGQCVGIDDEGALLVDTPGGRERCLSGVIRTF